MANKFIEVEYDKFTNKRETSMDSMTLLEEYDCYFKINLRHVSTPRSEGLLIDLYYRGDNWFFLRNGKLIININNVENISLEPNESFSHVMDSYDDEEDGKCEEEDYYEIDREILKKICDAKCVDFQIRGEAVLEANGERFIKYSQVFYNGFYDEDAYKEVLEENIDFISPADDGDDDDEESGRKDSTNDASGNGCMVTLLLMCSALSSIAACLFFIMGIF
jgi:hypothetical protein